MDDPRDLSRRDFLGSSLSLVASMTALSSVLGSPVVARGQEREGAVSGGPSAPVGMERVRIRDSFWMPIQKRIILTSIPHGIAQVQLRGIPSFVQAGRKLRGASFVRVQTGALTDSDVYKMVEAMSYALMLDPQGDPGLITGQKEIQGKLDEWIPILEAAQHRDGYLHTPITLDGTERWTQMGRNEFYMAGHFIEAAVAHYQATNREDPRLFNMAVKLADLIESLYGPAPKWLEASAHQGIELALVKLARLMDEMKGQGAGERYWRLARFFLDAIGHDQYRRHSRYSAGEHGLDLLPLNMQMEASGHAVKAMYTYTGVADVALYSSDTSYAAFLNRLWRSMVSAKMYITGGIGSLHQGERFGPAYDLPNQTSYHETCASIGGVMWSQRMNLLFGDAKYIDVLDRFLYNGVLVGMNLAGNRFWYRNRLESYGGWERVVWYNCACCPPNLMRLIASLGGYIYTQRKDTIHINLLIGNEAKLLVEGTVVRLDLVTDYPWDGHVRLAVDPARDANFAIKVRVPEWAYGCQAKVNGGAVPAKPAQGYVDLTREWRHGDVVELDWPMQIERRYADRRVATNADRVALQRGPIVYCLEQTDLVGPARSYVIEPTVELSSEHRPDLCNGVTVIRGMGKAGLPGEYQAAPFLAIPYYAWANRAAGDMSVWIREKEIPVLRSPIAAKATALASNLSGYEWVALPSINDPCLPVPAGSQDRSRMIYSNAPRTGRNWVQYTFDQSCIVSEASVYWFDDGKEIRVPDSWRLLYWTGMAWEEVATPEGKTMIYGVRSHQYNKCNFTPVTTTRLRIETLSKASVGILDWQVQ